MLDISHEYFRNCAAHMKKTTFGAYVISVLGPVPYLFLVILVFRALLLVIFVVSPICTLLRAYKVHKALKGGNRKPWLDLLGDVVDYIRTTAG